MCTIETFVHCSLKISSKCSSDGRRHVEDCNPLCELSLRVPAPKHKKKSWKEGRFEEADKEAEGVEFWDVLRAGLSERECAPGDFHDSKPVGGTDVLDNDIAWTVEDVGNDEISGATGTTYICITAYATV